MTDNGDYEPGFVVKLKAHKVRGKIQGYYVYLRRFELEESLGEPAPAELFATRTVLDAGTRQILIRLKTRREK